MIDFKSFYFQRTAIVVIGIAMAIHCTGLPAKGAVIYHGLQNIPIPTDFEGIYLNIDDGSTSAVEFTGWDLNPFFGGVGVGNSTSFQPARTGPANEAAILALGFGTQVGGNLTFSNGQGGSSSHLGGGASQFGIGQEAYLGFRFSTDGNSGPYYGWMRVVFTANLSGGIIKDWAYETNGLATFTGNVLQAEPVSGVSQVTLFGDTGQDATLGPLPGSFALAISKTGSGIWNLSEPADYSSLTTSGGLTRIQVSLTNATVTAGSTSTIGFEVSQTLTFLNIGEGGTVELSPPDISSAPPFENAAASVPEPGSAALLAGAFTMMLARTRRRAILRSAW